MTATDVRQRRRRNVREQDQARQLGRPARSGDPATASAAVRRGAGELEGAVLTALRDAGGPLTPTQLLAALGAGLAYNTVHTILTRLVDKNLVARVTQGGRRTYTYTCAADAARLSAECMRTTLEASTERPQVLCRFVASLSASDAALLRAILAGVEVIPPSATT